MRCEGLRWRARRGRGEGPGGRSVHLYPKIGVSAQCAARCGSRGRGCRRGCSCESAAERRPGRASRYPRGCSRSTSEQRWRLSHPAVPAATPEGAADPRARADELLRQVRVHSERRASKREQHGHGDEERAPGGVEPRPPKATWRGRGAGVGVGVGRAGRARASRGRVGRRAGARVLRASSSMSVLSQSCRVSRG